MRDIYPRKFEEYNGETIHAETCPDCEGTVRTYRGETVCIDCGLLVDECVLAHNLGGPTYEYDSDRKRTGLPLTVTRHDHGLSSEIGWGGDANGNALSSQKRRRIDRMRTQHTRSRLQSTAERNLAYALSEIQRLASAVEIPDSIQEQACVLFRTAQNEELLRGRSIESIAAGCVYAACRCNEYACSLAELGVVASCSHEKIRREFGVLNRELRLPIPVQRPQHLVPRLASACGVSTDVERQAIGLANSCEKDGLVNGRQPAGIAAACLYLASKEQEQPVTQEAVAGVAGTSITTLRERYYELQAHQTGRY